MSRAVSSLNSKNILIGVTGSIAAYKAAMLVRLLVSEGASVRVVMSHSAKDFITPLTMATVSRHPILVDNFDPENGAWNSHISLGEWADYYLIAPATANTIAKMRAGIADNLLLCTYLSARCAVGVAPAMDFDMYLHGTTQDNIGYLRDRGVDIIEPGEGFLASGLTGKGRMCEPSDIVEQLRDLFTPKPLLGKRIMVTAGATVEPIDPVRFISNHSTGKMGYAIADVLADMGAEVTVVSGAATAKVRNEQVKVVSALSAGEMYRVSKDHFEMADVAIFCAAVADYAPSNVSDEKIKHEQSESLTINLTRTKDIAAELGLRKRGDQRTICFALETDNERENALRKLERKNADAIVLNSLRDLGAGFGTDTNRVTIFERSGNVRDYELKDKSEVAMDIAQLIVEWCTSEDRD